MDVFIYQAALLCEGCGEKTREELTKEGKAPKDPDDEGSYDSDDFPKGPYSDGGGEANSFQHCDLCKVFLENPLTSHGVVSVLETFEEFIVGDRKGKNPEILLEWAKALKNYKSRTVEILELCAKHELEKSKK